jgi:Ca-activated chloride channel family protein
VTLAKVTARAFAICFLAVLPLSPGQTADNPQPQARLRADSDLVLVPVAVVDEHNHPVTGLAKENFRVFDNGAERTISDFAMEDEPIAVGLVFDHSGSVGGSIQAEAGATRLFLETSNPNDEFFLVIFAGNPEVTLPLTQDPGKIQSRVFRIQSSGWTALYDAVMLGLHELEKSNLKRKALLVVSDGGENNSRFSHRDLRRRIEESDALIYSIVFHTRDTDFPLMKSMAELSGGRAFLDGRRGLADVAAKIGLELRNRYVLGFSATGIPRDGKIHNLRVQLVPPRGMPSLKASWRRSYREPDDVIK